MFQAAAACTHTGSDAEWGWCLGTLDGPVTQRTSAGLMFTSSLSSWGGRGAMSVGTTVSLLPPLKKVPILGDEGENGRLGGKCLEALHTEC